jgi:RNA 2',3'-cyclic 3'-phosphodiesterase
MALTEPNARRLFLGIPPDPQSLKELTTLQQERKQGLRSAGVSWLHPRDLHLTLHFLGAVDAVAEGQIWSRLNEGGLGFQCAQPFDRFFHFPTPQSPRVEAVGAPEAVAPLQEIWETVGNLLKESGLPVDSRPYVPHVTLARLRGRVEIGPLPALSLVYPVKAIALYESRPGMPSRYRILQAFALDSDG